MIVAMSLGTAPAAGSGLARAGGHGPGRRVRLAFQTEWALPAQPRALPVERDWFQPQSVSVSRAKPGRSCVNVVLVLGTAEA